MCIILLLGSLTIYSISVSKQNVRQEIVKYNTLMLENTRNSYEKHLDLIKRQMYLYFFSEEVQRLQNSPRYVNFPLIMREISAWVSNPYLFIDNIVFYLKHGELVQEKGTTTNADAMFNVFYKSREYPLDFWRQQFTEPYTYRVFPAATFTNVIFRDRPQTQGELIPIMIKNQENQDFYMIVFLNAVKMYEAFHQSTHNDFIIYDDLGQTLFKSEGQESFMSLHDLQKYGSSEFIESNKYHFVTTGAGTGFNYVYRIPVERIANQSRLNITLVVIMTAAIALSVVIAFLFAARINNPLKKVIESIRSMNDDAPFRSNIKEFNIISDEIHGNHLMRKQLSFMNHLKAIRNHEHDTINLDFADKPFVFVLFQIQYDQQEPSLQASLQRWVYYMKTYIDSMLKPVFPDSLTFQIERGQILSLVFTEQIKDLARLLEQMKYVFDHDRQHGIVTISISSVYSDSARLTAAYEEAQELVGERQLIDETQIVRSRTASQMAVGFSPDQEKELEANLREGNIPQLTVLMERLFAKWRSKEPTAAAMLRFAESMTGKIRNAVTPFQLDPVQLESILEKAGEKIRQCATIRELELLLLDWVKRTAEAVKEKKEEKHPVTSFVIDYINDHLSEDIYVDVLAEKLKMSSGYLSTYFKGKTGKSIVDYINETRIAKAASLLADNDMKIHDAAKAVGYQNLTSFNRMFKKYTGLTPSEYRKRTDE
ncbi:helix-turn-helix domain-containing protein [Paenibacillus contaminans]|uniref:helix-turn-helix domain-containing protein n=1 Tax=Paenibacillus contaminans TaxID=450362 RepID=UPI0013146EDD|nr:helix-turn-helix domain-containing protein [Paenibacillus contaminans]